MQRWRDPTPFQDAQVTVGNRRRTAEHFLSVSTNFVKMKAFHKIWVFTVHMQLITAADRMV
jgi:hypothetical protein